MTLPASASNPTPTVPGPDGQNALTPSSEALPRRRLGLAALALLAGGLSGCVVVPWGHGRHHGHGHGRRDDRREDRRDDRRGR
jgi:hypothetical protein